MSKVAEVILFQEISAVVVVILPADKLEGGFVLSQGILTPIILKSSIKNPSAFAE